MDDVPLFDRTPAEFTFEDFKRLYDDQISPVTFEFDDDGDMYDDFRETVEYGWRSGHVIEGLGTFDQLAQWNGGDGRAQGNVIKHLESGTIMMVEGTYSSWGSSDWDGGLVEAGEFEFTETRYKEKK